MGKLSRTFIASVLFWCLSANSAFPVGTVVEWSFDTADFSIVCYDCDDWSGKPDVDCDSRNQYTGVYSSCTGDIHNRSGASGQRVEVWIRSQVSADGGALFDGDVMQAFSYETPVVLHRAVRIEKSKTKGRGVTHMVFPVVEWRFFYHVSGDLLVDGNLGAKGEGAAIHEIVLEPGSKKVINDHAVYTDGSEFIELTHPAVVTMEAPDLEMGDSITLDSYNCDNTNPHLQKLCSTEGDMVWFQSSQEYRFGINGKIAAWSNGGLLIDLFPIDGGEALACFGINSPLSSFNLECRPWWSISPANGIAVSIESETVDSVRHTVRQISPNQWAVVNVMSYEDVPTLRHFGLAILALLILGASIVGFRSIA